MFFYCDLVLWVEAKEAFKSESGGYFKCQLIWIRACKFFSEVHKMRDNCDKMKLKCPRAGEYPFYRVKCIIDFYCISWVAFIAGILFPQKVRFGHVNGEEKI